MESIIHFVASHWIWFLWLFLEVVFGVLLLLKKDKVREPLKDVLLAIPELVIKAEKSIGPGHGSDKRELVYQWACSLYKKMTGVSLFSGFYSKRILEAIEEILETPHKKEEK